MLRITVEEQEDLTTLRLEGKLKGDWVPELERCWMRTRSADPNRHLMVDLTAVSFVDESGKLLLKNLASRDAELLAHGNPFMSSLVNRIAGRVASSKWPKSRLN
jgi:anti-anti-sigma regulatory factor